MPLTTSQKKRKVLDGFQGKTGRPNKKFRKQLQYHSSSEESDANDADDEPTDFKAVDLADSDNETEKVTLKDTKRKQARKLVLEKKSQSDEEAEQSDSNASSDADENEDDGADSDDSMQASTSGLRAMPKRNDPSAFSTSISKILATKLPTSARADPVLSRSQIVTQTTNQIAEDKLDHQARAKLRAEKKEELDRGRVRDVRGISTGHAGAVAEEDKRLRKIAQRGVVKLFNAVRAAQVRGEEAAKEEKSKGTVGMGEREKTVNQVSKQGFLELINGKKGKPLNIEEA
ncbi:Rrp15p-domain-containing protein [Aspergillus cavernicola]|uniref:Rrp15p-domain-containing protein n=1 Tax=Aspergillus cavernicola TaxID=176166 RepID=A0ABR4IGA0_9EURO